MVTDEFVSKEDKQYRFKIGTLIASGLSGFLAGVVVGALAIWLIFWAISQKA